MISDKVIFSESNEFTLQVHNLAQMKMEWVDRNIKSALIDCRIKNIEITPIPRTKHLYQFILTTDAKPFEVGNVRYDLSKIVLRVKL